MGRKGHRLPPGTSSVALRATGRENERRAGRSCSSERAAHGHRQAQITLALPLFGEKVRADAQRLVFWLAHHQDNGRFTVARLHRICTGLALFERLLHVPTGTPPLPGCSYSVWMRCGTNASHSSISSSTGGVQGCQVSHPPHLW
jgi:hypothetical protein